jgi:hypothetical protein
MNRLTPLAKGLITAVAMIVLEFLIYYTKQGAGSKLNLVAYLIFASGIIWTLVDYRRFINPEAKFGELFGQGFRCFIVVAALLVTFTGIFTATHPEFAENDAKIYKEYLDKEVTNKTPAEKAEMVTGLKKHYTTGIIWSAIFGYLILGSIITAAGSGILLIRRN